MSIARPTKRAAFKPLALVGVVAVLAAGLLFTWGRGGDDTAQAGHISPTVVATIPVGTNPTGVGVNPSTDRVYVSNHLSSTVSVIADLPTPTEPPSVFYADNFDGSALDAGRWNTSLGTSGSRWCSTTVDNHHSNPGNWQDVAIEPCQGLTELPPYGAITVGGGEASFSAGPGRTQPYIWAGPPSRLSPFPSTGDLVLEVRMKYDSIQGHGMGFEALLWPNSDPVGNNPPLGRTGAALGIWADVGGLRANFLGGAVPVADRFSYHTYRLEYVGGAYSLLVDGVLAGGPVASCERPNAIWIGNPVFTYWHFGDSSDFRLDSVQILASPAQNDTDGDGLTDACNPDDDNDGVLDVDDACVFTPGLADRQGCLVGDANTVDLHIVNQDGDKTRCDPPAGSCKSPIAGAAVRVFDRNDADFQTAYGTKNPGGAIYDQVFENDIGRAGACTTDASGQCTAGEETIGDYLVIVKYVDPSGKTVYTGKPKSPDDFADTDGDGAGDLASKDFSVVKVIKKDGSVQLSGGSKTVVTGSYLEVVHPDFAVWEDAAAGYVYPFIFTSDSAWTVDVCAYVPTGYAIVGVYDENGNLISDSRCTQTFVAGETKVVAYEVVEVGSPEPRLDARLKVKHQGKVTTLDLSVPGIRKAKERAPRGLLAGDVLAAGGSLALGLPLLLAGAYVGLNKRRR